MSNFLADIVNGTWYEKSLNPEEKPKAEVINLDDRRHCKACFYLRRGFCIKQDFHPIDDIPRRCKDFKFNGGHK